MDARVTCETLAKIRLPRVPHASAAIIDILHTTRDNNCGAVAFKHLAARSAMANLCKRVRLERGTSQVEMQPEDDRVHKRSSALLLSLRLDLPAGQCPLTSFDYDCVNMALVDDSEGDSESLVLLPIAEEPEESVLFDFDDETEVDDLYKLELDLRLYLPRLNLKSDLRRIDQMFVRPIHSR